MNLLRRNQTPNPARYRRTPPLTIRWADADDAPSLEVLAQLDEAPVPPAPLMLGFVDQELWAAVSISTGARICDPFKPSGEISRLVAERGRQLTVPEASSRWSLALRSREPSRAGLKARLGQSAL